ncbi:sulfotransferase domain-containing protein [Shewanella aestuarii]|uniref:Sulfotransferase domain-containing protein n=1 Tax=Shewanella aestuarii TaxID=1028752 RepID=A0A6G9QJ84_9GAMM|nr:sulfotransferase domain-containing protein [Shewanella aestuarii]QIR13939.1 sulfotransferase domain-containing protein [Shewanella aestuarii]
MFNFDLFLQTLKTEHNMFQTRELPSIAQIKEDDLREIGSLLAYDNTIASLRDKNKQFVWHVALPKSGSTWLTNTLAALLNTKGWQNFYFLNGGGNRAQEISPSEILRQKLLDKHIFAQHQHCLYSDYTLDIIEKFNIKVILQVRDLKDCLISLKDHLDNETTIKPLFYMNDFCWNSLNEDQKLEFLIAFAAPWYVNFWAGWSHAITSRKIDVSLVNYSDLLTDFESIVWNIYQSVGYNKDAQFTAKLSELNGSVFTRKNIGKTGRGDQFSAEQKLKIQSLTSFFPDTDFSPIGL